jgi:hypothetical protein
MEQQRAAGVAALACAAAIACTPAAPVVITPSTTTLVAAPVRPPAGCAAVQIVRPGVTATAWSSDLIVLAGGAAGTTVAAQTLWDLRGAPRALCATGRVATAFQHDGYDAWLIGLVGDPSPDRTSTIEPPCLASIAWIMPVRHADGVAADRAALEAGRCPPPQPRLPDGCRRCALSHGACARFASIDCGHTRTCSIELPCNASCCP